MPHIPSTAAPLFTLPPHLSVIGLAAPSRGSRETCVWRLELAPGAPGVTHAVDREEIFVVLAGRGEATVGDEVTALGPGDTLIVPAGQSFALANPGAEAFVAMAVLPVGGTAHVPGSAPFVPPWAR
jgi:quercetin dioxygenase-like cupin family protein